MPRKLLYVIETPKKIIFGKVSRGEGVIFLSKNLLHIFQNGRGEGGGLFKTLQNIYPFWYLHADRAHMDYCAKITFLAFLVLHHSP